MLTSPSGPVRVSRASVRRVPSTRGDAAGVGSASVGRCATNAAPSSTSSHSTACGESSDAWKPAPVGGVEGLGSSWRSGVWFRLRGRGGRALAPGNHGRGVQEDQRV